MFPVSAARAACRTYGFGKCDRRHRLIFDHPFTFWIPGGSGVLVQKMQRQPKRRVDPRTAGVSRAAHCFVRAVHRQCVRELHQLRGRQVATGHDERAPHPALNRAAEVGRAGRSTGQAKKLGAILRRRAADQVGLFEHRDKESRADTAQFHAGDPQCIAHAKGLVGHNVVNVNRLFQLNDATMAIIRSRLNWLAPQVISIGRWNPEQGDGMKGGAIVAV